MVRAMKSSKWANKFHHNFIHYSLASSIVFLFFFYPFWSPSVKRVLSSLLNHISSLHNAKWFFIVGNLIVFVLVGESKLKRFSHSSSVVVPASNIYYDEYVATSRSKYTKIYSEEFLNIGEVMRSPNVEEKKVGNEGKLHWHEEKKRQIRVCKSENIVKSEKAKGQREDLTQRVEAFIARVNSQRLLEAKLIDHYIA